MKISEYIQHRHNLEQLDIGKINKFNYEDTSDNYKKLLKVSKDNPKKLDELGLYFSSKITWFYIIFGALLSFFFSLGYANNKEINISLYIFMVIFIPFLFNMFILFQYIYFIIKKKSINISLDYSSENFLLKTCLKASIVFYLKLLMFIYTICSAILLLIYSTIMHFSFIIETTTLSATTITKILNILSVPVKFIFPSIIPTYDKIVLTINLPTDDDIWLLFLLMLTFTWVIILRMIILLISKKQLNKIVKVSLLNNSKSQNILKYIKPETSIIGETVGQSKKVNKTNISSKIIKLDLSNKNISNFRTFLLWHLCEEAIINMRNSLNNTNIDLIVLKSARELNLEDIRKESSLLIIINVDNPPQGKFIRLLERVSEFNVTIKFIDEKGEFTDSNKNIAEWSRFLEENNIRIEVTHE